MNPSKMQQATNTILMIRPVRFRKNEQTSVNNHFQEDINLANEKINRLAQNEFDAFVNLLESKGIKVIVVEDIFDNDTPDSIFPNNWISFHQDGTVAFYPMFAKNRRRERRLDIWEILKKNRFHVSKVKDYTDAEKTNLFLEGTGSMVLDRENKTAYCSLSERANKELFLEFCKDFMYTPVFFTSYQTVGNIRKPIYHTNVVMCVTSKYVIICLDCIDNMEERENVIDYLEKGGKQIIPISEKQLYQFAGNMLEVLSPEGKSYLVMSSSAYNSLTSKQISSIDEHSLILHSNLDTIETLGGGSARCMIAEVFLPTKKEVLNSK